MNAGHQDTIERLAALGIGDLDPAEASRAVRDALAEAPELGENIYAALRDLVWRTVASREFGSDLGHWFHVVERAGTGLRAAGQQSAAERVDVLADLLHQSATFARRQPLEEIVQRKHVGGILAHLVERGSECRREKLREASGLSDPNLSRVLALLEGHGLVTRRRSGKEMVLALTGSGRDAARSLGQTSMQLSRDKPPPQLIEHLVHPLGCWDGHGRLYAANAASRDLARTLGAELALEELSSWRAAVEAASSGVRGEPGAETWLLRIDNGHWCDATFSSSDGVVTTFLAIDVTHHKEREAEFTSELQALREGLSRAKRQVAEAEEGYVAYARTVGRVRDFLVSALQRIEDRKERRHLAKLGVVQNVKTSEAFQYIMRECLAPPEPTEHSLDVDVAAYVEQMVASIKNVAGGSITSDLDKFRGTRVSASAARHTVNQLLFGATKPGATPGGSLTAKRGQEGLILQLTTYRSAVSPALLAGEEIAAAWMGRRSELGAGGAFSGRSTVEIHGDFTIKARDEDQAEIAMATPMRIHDAH